MSRTIRRQSAPRGFTLIELLVSLTVLALALVGIAPMMLKVAHRTTDISRTAYRNAAVTAAARRQSLLSWTQLTAGTSCDTITAPPLPNKTCTTVSTVSSNLKRVTIVVKPDSTLGLRPDTLVVDRSNLAFYNPMNYP